MNQSVIIDNVMVNKSALEMLKLARSGSSLGNLGDIAGSYRSQFTDQNCKCIAASQNRDLFVAFQC